jgi:threonine/homoserine/homoserine lactone efflux protein
MTRDAFVAFALFTIAAAGTPGPSNALLTATGARVGVLRGLPALLGAGLGMGVLMAAVALGLGALVLANQVVATVARWCGVAFLLWLAWKVATAGPLGESSGRPVGFVGAALFQWINPKSWLICASATATFLAPGSAGAVGQAIGLGALFAAIATPCFVPWLAFGALLQRTLRSPRAARIVNVAMGLLLGLSVVLLFPTR